MVELDNITAHRWLLDKDWKAVYQENSGQVIYTKNNVNINFSLYSAVEEQMLQDLDMK